MEWQIFPLDVLFFKGTDPMNAGEAAVVQSMFPPSPEVLQGFVRTALLEAADVPFAEYSAAMNGRGGSARAREMIELLGSSEAELGQLRIRGPYLIQKTNQIVIRRYPAPLDLYRPRGTDHFERSVPGKPVQSDLGEVAFLDGHGESASGRWISERGLETYLQGQPVPAADLISQHDLLWEEPRVGIARDNVTNTTIEGMLYAPGFLRLDEREGRGTVGIGIRVSGVDDALQQHAAGVRRLGGESRLVSVELGPDPGAPLAPPLGNAVRVLLTTPGRWGGRWYPPGFRQREDGVWHGMLGPARGTLRSAAVGKAVWIGGWDMAARRPKPAVACVPAGSVYLVEVDAGSLDSLHDETIGMRGQAGFGQVLVGAW